MPDIPLIFWDILILIPRTRLSRLAQVLWLLRHASLHHHPRFCVPTPGLMQMERLRPESWRDTPSLLASTADFERNKIS